MKKALQTGHLRAQRSLSEGAAGLGRREAHRDRFCDDFAEVLVADPSNEGGRLHVMLRGGLDTGPLGLAGPLRRRLWKRSRDEDEPRRCQRAKSRTDLVCPKSELERPDRVLRVDPKRA